LTMTEKTIEIYKEYLQEDYFKTINGFYSET
jgi:hypothetical protein